MAISKNDVTLKLLEKASVPGLDRLPKDLKLRSVTLKIRGTVLAKGAAFSLVAKGSGRTLSLANPKGANAVDQLAALKKQLGGKNRFIITGKLKGRKKIVISAIEKTDWKDSK